MSRKMHEEGDPIVCRCDLCVGKPKEPSMKEEWCKHIFWDKDDDGWNCVYTNGTETIMYDDDSFCPICGTPRPTKPKKLWEKFAETSIVRGDATCGMSTQRKADILADIATKHFKQFGGNFK